jgi:hypothetical protein
MTDTSRDGGHGWRGGLCHRYAVPRNSKGMGHAVPWVGTHGYCYVSATRLLSGRASPGLSNAASSMRISSRKDFGHASCSVTASNITMTRQWRDSPSGTGLPKVRCRGSSSTATDSKTLMQQRWGLHAGFSTGLITCSALPAPNSPRNFPTLFGLSLAT